MSNDAMPVGSPSGAGGASVLEQVRAAFDEEFRTEIEQDRLGFDPETSLVGGGTPDLQRRHGATLVMVTHDPVVAQHTQRIVSLYDPADLDALLYPDRRLFESWAHAACLIPVEDYAYFAPLIQARRQEPPRHWIERRLGDEPQAVLDAVLAEVRARVDAALEAARAAERPRLEDAPPR